MSSFSQHVLYSRSPLKQHGLAFLPLIDFVLGLFIRVIMDADLVVNTAPRNKAER